MKKVIQASLVSVMLISTASVSYAASNPKAKAVPVIKTAQKVAPNPNYVFPIQNKIKLSSNSYAQLTDINMDSADDSNTLTYTVVFYNGDKAPIDLLDYWVRIKSKLTGSTYSSVISTADKAKSKILPKSSQTIRFFSKIDKSVNLSDLVFDIVKWDFSSPDYARKLGEIQIPKTFDPAVGSGLYKTVNVTDIPIKMNLSSFSTAKLQDGQLMSLNLQMQNTGKKILTAQKYNFYLKTDTGTTYPLNMDSSQNLSIAPNGKKTIALGATIPSEEQAKKWILQVNQVDDTAKVDLGLGSFKLPTASTTATDMYQEKLMTINDKKVGVTVKYASVMNTSDQAVAVTVSLVNRDSSAVTLPKYDYMLGVSGGYSFPLTLVNPDTSTSTSLNPLQVKTISLKATVPANMSLGAAQMFMIQQVTGSAATPDSPAAESTGIPVAMFNLNQLSSGTTGRTVSVDTQSGSYMVTLDSVQRLPWADSDVLGIHFRIRNPSFANAVPVPNLQGKISIDGIATADADTKFIQTDNVASIEPNGVINGYMVSKLPYYSNYGVLQIVLQEKVGDNVSDLAQFVTGPDSTNLPEVAVNNWNKIEIKGKTSELKVRTTKLYQGTGSNILYTEFEVNNLESRLSTLSQFTGYYTSGDGSYYKATIKQQETPTSANSKSLVTVWSQIPRTVSTDNLKLILGQSIADKKLSAPKQDATSYVNGALYDLPKDVANVQRTLLGLDFLPYTFSITSLSATLTGGSSTQVSLDYNLTKDLSYESPDSEHKIVLQMLDTATGTTMEKELSFTDLSEGSQSLSYSVNSSNLVDKTYGVFTLNVFDSYQGQRKEIATQSFFYTGGTK